MSDETDVNELAHEVIAELDPGTVIDDKFVLSRRQVIALSTGALSLGALAGFGAGDAQAQAAGAVGTDSDPVDVHGYDVGVSGTLTDPGGTSHTGELADASDVTITDGDGVSREIYVIASGASDPSGAGADDLIFEEDG